MGLDYDVDNDKFCGLIASHIKTNYLHALSVHSGVTYYDDEFVRFALAFHCVGSWNEAEKLEVQVIEAREKKLGSYHPETLRSKSNLAATYRKQGKWDEAEKLEVQVMEVREARLI